MSPSRSTKSLSMYSWRCASSRLLRVSRLALRNVWGLPVISSEGAKVVADIVQPMYGVCFMASCTRLMSSSRSRNVMSHFVLSILRTTSMGTSGPRFDSSHS